MKMTPEKRTKLFRGAPKFFGHFVFSRMFRINFSQVACLGKLPNYNKNRLAHKRQIYIKVEKGDLGISKLYYELEMLKSSNDKIRRDTANLISKNRTRY